MEGLGISKSKGLSMVRRLSLAIVVLVVVCGRQAVKAEPITYKFSGGFVDGNGWPTGFSGSFTIDTEKLSLILPQNGGMLVGQIPFTLNFAGQTFGPTADVSLTPNGPMVEAEITSGGGHLPNEFGFLFDFDNIGTLNQFVDLSKFNFSESNLSSISYSFMASDGMWVSARGEFDSYQAVPAPEPSTLLVFMALVGAAWAHHRYRRTREVMTE